MQAPFFVILKEQSDRRIYLLFRLRGFFAVLRMTKWERIQKD